MSEDFIIQVALEGAAAGFIAIAFAMLFAVQLRHLPWVGLGGLVTRVLRTVLFQGLGMEVAVATFLACSVTSLMFIAIAPRLGTPRPVFTVASIIALVPGIDAYTCLLTLYAVIDDPSTFIGENAYLIIHHGMRCFAILLSICFGIAIPPLFFYRYRKNEV